MENGARTNLNGRVGLVTGGASGIGYSIADRLAQLGASVLVFDLDGEKARAAAREVEDRHGGKAVGVQGSVTSAGDRPLATAMAPNSTPIGTAATATGVMSRKAAWISAVRAI